MTVHSKEVGSLDPNKHATFWRQQRAVTREQRHKSWEIQNADGVLRLEQEYWSQFWTPLEGKKKKKKTLGGGSPDGQWWDTHFCFPSCHQVFVFHNFLLWRNKDRQKARKSFDTFSMLAKDMASATSNKWQKELSQRLWSMFCYFQLEIHEHTPQNDDDKLYPRITFPYF